MASTGAAPSPRASFPRRGPYTCRSWWYKALTGECDDDPDQTAGWLRALSGDHGDEAEVLFDAAIRFVERKHPNPNPNVEAKPKRKLSPAEAAAEAAVERMKRQRQ